ncbi:MAG: helix-hairpin-helix domain-containing protein [Limisphaerales bacterium]
MIEMLEISGLGPKKIQAMHKKLGVDSIEKLEAACKAGRVAELKVLARRRRRIFWKH